jgi:CRP/FNR family transcriptional regulator, cyclic AMP receptor protein
VERARLERIPFFAGLPDEELAAVAAVASEVRLDGAGAVLTSEGDFGHGLLAIETGTAEVTVDGRPVGTVGPGDVVGEIAVLASGRRTASVVATSALTAVTLFKSDVWALETAAPVLTRRLRDTLERHRQGDAQASA